MPIDGVVVDYMANMFVFAYPKEGELVWEEFIPQLDLVLQGDNEVAEAIFHLDGEEIYRESKLSTGLSIDSIRLRARGGPGNSYK